MMEAPMNAITTTRTTVHPLLLLALALGAVMASSTASLAEPPAAQAWYDPCWDTECGPCEVCEDGACFATPGESGCADPDPTKGPQQINCEETEGTWDECAESSCDICADCIGACLCPDGTSFEDAQGCVDLSELVFDKRCARTGGTSICEAPDCAPDEPCLAICMMVCECPQGLLWDNDAGCLEAPPMEILCEQSGGELACEPFECPADDADCAIILVCNEQCTCPEEQAYDTLQGCIDAPVDMEVPAFEGCSQSGMGPFAGCSGGGAGGKGSMVLVLFALMIALRTRRVLA